MNYHRLEEKVKYWGTLTPQTIMARLGYYSKPTFLIAGTQKGGTSALSAILKQHSLIHGSVIKELHFFNNNKNYKPQKLWKYHRWFPLPFRLPKDCQVFDATPGYMFNPEAAERIYNYNPSLKLIIILRNPAERALSAWSMFHCSTRKGTKSQQRDPRTFDEAVQEELNAFDANTHDNYHHEYLCRVIYVTQMERLLKFFSKEQFLFWKAVNSEKNSTKPLQRFSGS